MLLNIVVINCCSPSCCNVSFYVLAISLPVKVCHTAAELNLGLKKIVIKTEHAASDKTGVFCVLKFEF